MNFFKNFSMFSFLAYSKFGMQVLEICAEVLAYTVTIALVLVTMNRQFEHAERISKLEQSCLTENQVKYMIDESNNHYYIGGLVSVADPSEPDYQIPIMIDGVIELKKVSDSNKDSISLDF